MTKHEKKLSKLKPKRLGPYDFSIDVSFVTEYKPDYLQILTKLDKKQIALQYHIETLEGKLLL